jgi:hypothetical protein
LLPNHRKRSKKKALTAANVIKDAERRSRAIALEGVYHVDKIAIADALAKGVQKKETGFLPKNRIFSSKGSP